MTKKTFVLIAIASCVWIATSFAATIPAGTTLVVQTLNTIHSNDRVGRTFTAQLDQDVVVNGKVVLQAGTKFHGKIEASQANPRNSQPLTLNLTDVSVNGRDVAVRTNSFEPGSPKTVRGRRAGQISIGTFVVQPRSKMQFQLVQPVTL